MSVIVPATATVSAAPFFLGLEIRIGGNASKLEGFADVLIDRLMDVMHLFLCFEESAGNWICQQGFALFFK